ncbi:thioesterase family protein [Arenicella xantha]|uniref:Acyl-CoA thioesterase n=1 Tax=Arenicella xantha TaxID=644221 RepID=A0A395JMS3_9GAMM|nr:thioesterase family protein [Arenicella xantha]RBP50928.1 acyl-CoA thioesterase [Arenicella xantha]
MSQPSFSELLDNLDSVSPESWSVTITPNWMQGRTTYGGLSAALCLQAVLQEYSDLPPLRSAQINFIGPVGGTVSIKTSILRQGRSVCFISAEMWGEKGLGTHAVFCFGAKRESRLNSDFTSRPTVPNIADSVEFFDTGQGPEFARNYDCVLASGGRPISGSKISEHYIWVRHKDRQANNLAALVGIADMPPPAVLPMFEDFAPISSMNWTLNFLSEDISTEDGWWLMRSAAEHARDGYSSQDMQVWNSEGKLVISALQSVALFY